MTSSRRKGVALWRQIADQLRGDLRGWAEESEGRVPTEAVLARRFGVNRHTVRAALAALAGEGLIRSEQGKGTFVRTLPRISYPISSRTRFSAALEAQSSTGRFEVLGHEIVEADAEVAARLSLSAGVPVIKLDTLGLADGAPISFGTHWFAADRFAELPPIVEQTGSITEGLKVCGVDDYVRLTTEIEARRATGEEARHLDTGAGAIVLLTLAVNADLAGQPIQYSEGRFDAARVRITMGNS